MWDIWQSSFNISHHPGEPLDESSKLNMVCECNIRTFLWDKHLEDVNLGWACQSNYKLKFA